MAGLIVAIAVAFFVLVLASRMVRIIPQARAGVVERLGRYSRTLDPGLTLLVPFIDRVKPLIDLREQVVNFSPQPVITEDNVVVGIETVLYFTITEPKSATYEIANPLQAIEQLTVTTLRNVIGGLTLEATLTARESVNVELRGALDDATGKWGIRINRVEIKSVDPPADIRAAMEKQMRAERDRRAAILTAQGTKQAAILTAEGEKQSAVLKAEGARQAAILRAEGEAKAIATVFDAIHLGDPDEKLLSYQYLQMLPELARGDSNKVFVIPSEFTQAFAGIGSALNEYVGRGLGGAGGSRGSGSGGSGSGGSGSGSGSGGSGGAAGLAGTPELGAGAGAGAAPEDGESVGDDGAAEVAELVGETPPIGESGLTDHGELAADPGAGEGVDLKEDELVGELDLGLLPGDASFPVDETPLGGAPAPGDDRHPGGGPASGGGGPA
jgi:regulator of protease activity HflC (stomatin/prohibitin superfamily)